MIANSPEDIPLGDESAVSAETLEYVLAILNPNPV